MGRRKDLTEDQRGAIIYSHQRGDPVRTIAVAVGCSKSIVQNIIQEYRQVGAEAKKKKKDLDVLGFFHLLTVKTLGLLLLVWAWAYCCT